MTVIVKYDRYKNDTEVIICQGFDDAKERLKEEYKKELVNNRHINFNETRIEETRAIIDYVYGLKEIRITNKVK